MIKIRLTGTHDELIKAMSITRSDYTVVSRSKPHQVVTNPLSWNIYIKAEIKPLDASLQPPQSKLD